MNVECDQRRVGMSTTYTPLSYGMLSPPPPPMMMMMMMMTLRHTRVAERARHGDDRTPCISGWDHWIVSVMAE